MKKSEHIFHKFWAHDIAGPGLIHKCGTLMKAQKLALYTFSSARRWYIVQKDVSLAIMV